MAEPTTTVWYTITTRMTDDAHLNWVGEPFFVGLPIDLLK